MTPDDQIGEALRKAVEDAKKRLAEAEAELKAAQDRIEARERELKVANEYLERSKKKANG